MPQLPHPPHTRRNVWTLPAGDPTLDEYAQAVAVMRARPASDPTSWTYQAAMHGTHATHVRALWNGCQHGTWFFVAWHRMFLYFFEQIVRAAVVQSGGSASWALPYWNYGAGGTQATLPQAFRSPTRPGGGANPLYVAQRAPGINGGLALSPAVASAAHALSRPRYTGVAQFGGGVTPVQQFSSSTGQLEQTPHNDVHVAVGGNGWMSDPDQAAADPIFWLHHANIDRLWSHWIAAGHHDPTDHGWTGQTFEFFDSHGHRVSKICADVRDTVKQLGYTYDDAPKPPTPHAEGIVPMAAGGNGGEELPEPELVGASEQPVELVGVPSSVTVDVDQRAREQTLARIAGPETHRIYLSVEDIQAERNPGTVYGIYVNLPPDASPDVAARHHAGNVSFFGVERARNPRGDERPHSLRVVRDITDLAHDLAAHGQWDDQHVEVTFRPLGLIPEDQPELAHALPQSLTGSEPPVTIGRVSVLYG